MYNIKKAILALLCSVLFLGAGAQVKWHTVSEAANAKIGQRMYFVDYYTSGCGYCKKMDRETFSDPTVAKILNKYYYPVKFDAESAHPVQWFGHEYKPTANSRTPIHEFARGVQGFPTFRFFRSNGEVFHDIPGYYSAKDFTIILWYFASGDCDRYPFEKYMAIFDAEIRSEMEKQLKK